MVGTVRDPSGAAVPTAAVIITNMATNVAQTVKTDADGQYVAPLLRVGLYSVAVEKTGFQKVIRSGIRVDVQSRLQVDVNLLLGAMSELVQVTDAPPLLDTQSASVGQVIGDRAVSELPLNGRRYDDLVFLTTGVNTVTPVMAARGEGLFSVDGNTSLQNNFILDGIDNNSYDENMSSRSSQVVVPSVDALSEFKIQTHTYDVSFGRNAGSAINATIKSGTNQFHGNAWEFLRNKDLDANDFFLNKAGQPKAQFQQNQFGGTFGGPVKKNHTFFFVNEEHTSIRQGTTLVGSVPTPLMRQYNFSELKTSPHSPTLAALSQFGNCFNGTTVVLSCIDPVGAKVFALYPLPNTNLAQNGVTGGFAGNNYIASPVLQSDADAAVARVDSQWHESNKFFGHFAVMDSRRFTPGIFNDLQPSYIDGAGGSTFGNNLTRGTSVAAGWTRIISAGILNEFRAGYNHVASHSQQAPFGTPSENAAIGLQGIPNYPASTVGGGLASFTMTSFANLGSPTFLPGTQLSSVFQFEDSLSVIRGEHTLRFGGGWRRDSNTPFDDCCVRGYLNFNGQYTGSALTDLLLGLPQNAGLATLTAPYSYNDTTSVFAQDTWRASSRLTLNYGVRWEYTTPRVNDACGVSNFDPSANGGQGGVVTPPAKASGTYDCSLVHPWHLGFAPRLGVAYRITDKLVFRGGGGFFFQGIDRQGSESLLELNPPYYLDTRASVPSTQVPTIILKNGFPADTLTPYALDNYTRLKQLSMFRAVDPNLRPAQVQNFSAGFEYSLTRDLLLDMGWVGNFAHHEWALGNLNQGYFVTPGQAPVKPFPNFPVIEYKAPIGNANYNALQAKLEKRFSKGLSFLLNYTWSKAMADYVTNLEVGAGAGNGRTFYQNWYNRQGDKALAINDQPQRTSFALSYDIPAGKGHHVLNEGLAGQVFGGWQLNGIYTYSSGQAIGVISPNDTSTTGVIKVNVTRANCVSTPKFSSGGSVSQWFDTSAFAVPGTYQFGTCSNSPGIWSDATNNMNFSLFKNISFSGSDRYRAQLRTEFFNVFNHSQFAPPSNLTVGTPGFGSLTSLLQSPRQIQFALKLFF